MNDRFGAFLSDGIFTIEGKPGGPLDKLTFAAKDVFDVAGHPTGNGQPTWRNTHPAPEKHAPTVAALLDAGATFVGKTVCDEMCYSLAGDNAHYGAPLNPAAPDRAVGGSSSGSAAAVAGELVDFALGTDCGGSVRCPASFSGIYGIRPTHDRVDDGGVAPLAGSFDVVGWFARDPALLSNVGHVLLDSKARLIAPRRALLPEDAFSRMPSREREAAEVAAAALADRMGIKTERIVVAREGLDRWFAAFRHLQALEIWEKHADWVRGNNPEFGPGVKERFEYASTLTNTDLAEHQPIRDIARGHLAELLDEGDTVILMPTAPVSPNRDAAVNEVEAFRAQTMGLTCIAGLTGCPQVTMPLAHEAAPIGVSLLGPRGSDESLLTIAVEFA